MEASLHILQQMAIMILVASASTGLTVTNTGGNNYKIARRLKAPSTNSLLGNVGSGGVSYGNSTLQAYVSVKDNNNNSSFHASNFTIYRQDLTDPIIGPLIARSGSLNSITLSNSSQTYSHQIKVAARDNQSGLKSVTMNNGYVADSPNSATENGVLYFYFKDMWTFNEVWQNKHNSTTTITNLQATAIDNQNRTATTASGVNVEATALDTQDPSIISKTLGSSTLNMNTSNVQSATQTFSVVIEDNDQRESAVTVVVTEVENR